MSPRQRHQQPPSPSLGPIPTESPTEVANSRQETNETCPLGPSLNVGKADDITRGGLGLSTQKCLGEEKKKFKNQNVRKPLVTKTKSIRFAG